MIEERKKTLRSQESRTLIEADYNYLSEGVSKMVHAITCEFPAGNPTGNEFPIVAYEEFPHSCDVGDYDATAIVYTPVQTCEINLYEKIKQCGFNMVVWGSQSLIDNEVMKTFYIPMVKNLGLRLSIVTKEFAMCLNKESDQEGYENTDIPRDNVIALQEIVKNLGILDPVCGWMIADEPKSNDWRLSVEDMPRDAIALSPTYNLCVVKAPKKVPFFNLACTVFPEYIGSEIAGKKNIYDNVLSIKEQYMLYLGELCRMVHPKMLTYDFYPIHYKLEDHVATNTLEVRSDYFQYLEALGEFSQLNNIPVWALILSNQHNVYSTHKEGDDIVRDTLVRSYPLPNSGILRFQAFNAMAFGMQGIEYWTYSMPSSEQNNAGIEYITAPVVKISAQSENASNSDNGEPGAYKYTSVWDNAKMVNAEIRKFGNILLGAKYFESKHVYGPKKTQSFLGAKVLGSSTIGCIHTASTDGKGFVVCRLLKDDVNYLAIVSHDPVTTQSIVLGISTNYYCYKGEYGEQALRSDFMMGSTPSEESIVRFGFNLNAGGMLLLSYKQRLDNPKNRNNKDNNQYPDGTERFYQDITKCNIA